MTTIIAAIDPAGNIHISGDIRISDPETGRYWDSQQTPKIAVNGPYTYGVAGDQALVQHIIHGWEPPQPDTDPILAMHTQILPSLKEHIGDMDGEWEVLIGFHKMLFIADKAGFTHDDRFDYMAIGSGATFALGYVAGKWDAVTDISRLISASVTFASRHNTNTSPECLLMVNTSGKR